MGGEDLTTVWQTEIVIIIRVDSRLMFKYTLSGYVSHLRVRIGLLDNVDSRLASQLAAGVSGYKPSSLVPNIWNLGQSPTSLSTLPTGDRGAKCLSPPDDIEQVVNDK